MRKNEKRMEIIMSMAGMFVAALIAGIIFVPEPYRYGVLMVTAGIWAAIFCCKWIKERKNRQKQCAMQVFDLEPDYKRLFSQQLQLRVQEKLRMKFPDATVDLCEKEIERVATLRKAVYVPIRKADNYCHISILLKNTGEIQMNLFSLVHLENICEAKSSVPAEPERDVEQWFTQKGQQLLTELITNMNGRGYTKLSISENGDVTVKENGRNVLKDHFQEIPPKKQWAKLKELMADEDVQVQVSGRQLTLAW